MNRAVRKVANEIADGLKDPTGFDWTTRAKHWLVLLAPPKRKIRARDSIRGAKISSKKELWEMVRTIVRARANGLCEYCPEVGRNNGLRRVGNQGCHVFPKGTYPHVRFDLDNVFWGCADCHKNKWHGFNPDRIDNRIDWWRRTIGATQWEGLHTRALARRGGHVDLIAIKVYLTAEANKLGVADPAAALGRATSAIV